MFDKPIINLFKDPISFKLQSIKSKVSISRVKAKAKDYHCSSVKKTLAHLQCQSEHNHQNYYQCKPTLPRNLLSYWKAKNYSDFFFPSQWLLPVFNNYILSIQDCYVLLCGIRPQRVLMWKNSLGRLSSSSFGILQ